MSKAWIFLRGLHGWTVWGLFWLRELVGWVLLVLGLLLFYQVFVYLVAANRILPTLPLFFLGFLLFRAGLQLLKVSTAALVCLQAQGQREQRIQPNLPRRSETHLTPFELGPLPQR